jgi:N-acyl-D-amino-acid deacylase
MHDTVIRGGTIIDGTGEAAFTGDVAICTGNSADVILPTSARTQQLNSDGLGSSVT